MQTTLNDHGFTIKDHTGFSFFSLLTSKRSGINMPKKEVIAVVNVPTGDYKGTITKNEVITRGKAGETFDYHITHVELATPEKPTLEKGVPFSITENTLLGQMLKAFGADVAKAAKEGKEIDTDDYLKIGTKVTVSIVRKTINAKTGGGTFEVSNIEQIVPAK